MPTMAERRMTIAKVLHLMALGASEIGAAAARGIPMRVAKVMDMLGDYVIEDGIDFDPEIMDREWDELEAIAAEHEDATRQRSAERTRTGTLAMADRIMGQLFTQDDIINELIGGATAKEHDDV